MSNNVAQFLSLMTVSTIMSLASFVAARKFYGGWLAMLHRHSN